MVPSVLDDATLAAMRAQAQAEHGGPFIDPALFRDGQAALGWVDKGWLARVTGHASWRELDNAGLWLALRAARADAEHLNALFDARRARYEQEARDAAGAAETARRAAWAEWEALRARLPAPVAVFHNWTARHLDGYEQGADHIVVLEDLHAGRLHRTARSPLCWTPSRAHELRHVSGNVGDERRIPDCKACLRHAERIARAKEG